MGGASNGRRRRFRSREEKRAIVEETLKPGVSVSQIARDRGVNTNQVFTWRRLYRTGRLEILQESNALVPVKISDHQVEKRPGASRSPTSGIIDIDLGHARVRIEGAADPDCVRAAVEGLLR